MSIALHGCGPDAGQIRLCTVILNEMLGSRAVIVSQSSTADEREPGVTLAYRVGGSDSGEITCRFAGGRFDEGRLELVGVETSELGELPAATIAYLRRRLDLP